MPNTIIIGSGSYIPNRIIGRNHFLDSTFFDDKGEKLDKPTKEIIDKFVEITEIENRRYIDDEFNNSDMGYEASKQAIEEAKVNPEEFDYILYASNFGDANLHGRANFMPNLAARVKNKLGITNRKCITYDMIFGCPGWVEALILADILIKSKNAKQILVIGGDTLSRITDPFDRNKMIFADGAAAVVVKATEQENVGIISHNTVCDNQLEIDFLKNAPSLNKDADQGDIYIRMQGRKIYEYALKNVPIVIKETIENAGLNINDIDKILLHQANAKMDHAMIDRLMKLYGIKEYDHEIAPMTIQEFGNSSVATVPTMYDLIKKKKLGNHQFMNNSNIVFASVGAGMNINAIVYRFP